jgi:apolipoprotein N-acyltransferase
MTRAKRDKRETRETRKQKPTSVGHRTWIALALSVLAGVMEFFGFVGFGIFPLAWIALVPVLVAVRDEPPKRAFFYGMVFGTIAHAGGYYWVAQMLEQFGGLPTPLAYLGLLLLCAYQAIAFAALLVLVRVGEQRLKLAPIWTLAIAYPAIEFLFPLLFPYYIGNSQYRFTALTQIVDVTGMLGLTVLIALLNGAFYELLDARLSHRRILVSRVATTFSIFAMVVLYGLVRLSAIDSKIAATQKLKVAIVQANLGGKDTAGKADEFIRRHLEMSREVVTAHPSLDLLVWPEAAYNRRIPRGEMNVHRRVLVGIDKPLLFGALTAKDKELWNSAILTSSTGAILGRFDKVELVVFGETVPFVETFPSIRSWFPRSSTFARGTSFKNLQLGPWSFMPMICYEDILPAFVRRLWREAGPADVLVNITNDSWYGDSHEPWTHLVLATFRSIETRRSLIRATNTGISAIVDPAGRIAAHTGQWTQETLVAEVSMIEDGSSTIYQRIGDVLGWISCVAVVAGIVLACRHRT